MSEEMARKKQEDIERVEKEEIEMLREVAEDRCPNCGLPTAQLEFFNPHFIKIFGWVECTRCGVVYAPKSVLKQKRLLARSGLSTGPAPEPSSLIIPS